MKIITAEQARDLKPEFNAKKLYKLYKANKTETEYNIIRAAKKGKDNCIIYINDCCGRIRFLFMGFTSDDVREVARMVRQDLIKAEYRVEILKIEDDVITMKVFW